MTTEMPLLNDARNGDVAAFGALVRTHDERMRALAYRMLGSRAAMDDVLQDAYVKAFRSIGSFRGEAEFSTWLHRIVVRTCIDHVRRQARREEVALTDDGWGHHATGPSDTDPGVAVSRQLDLRRALARLPGDQRAALLLVDGEGLSYDEAGEVLGVPAGTVSSRISRARRQMRALLEPSRSERPEDER